jgi:hypothetical protein
LSFLPIHIQGKYEPLRYRHYWPAATHDSLMTPHDGGVPHPGGPMKTHLIRYVLLLVFAAVTASSGCGLLGGGESDNTINADPDECGKDRDELSRLLARPQACATSETCPTGSYCDPLREACTWQCFTDSDCGTGFECTCDGVCIGGDGDGGIGGGGDGGGDPSCPRVEALVEGLLTTPRACTFDEQCPYGSHCDEATGRCAFECLGTDHATHGCDGSEVCDCLGECVGGNATPAPVDPQRRLLTVTPAVISVPGATWAAQPLDVVVRTYDKSVVSATPPAPPTVIVRAPAQLRIVARQTAPGDGDAGWVRELTISNLTFTAQPGGVYVATQRVWVRPQSLDANTGPWTLEIVGSDVDTAASVVVNVEAPVTVNDSTGLFKGELIDITHGDAALTRIPVTLWASSDFVLFLDESRALSGKAAFGAKRDGSKLGMTWIARASGSMSVNVNLTSASGSPVTKLTDNILEITLPVSNSAALETLRFQLAVQRADDVPATTTCTSDTFDCGTGNYCEVGLSRCAPGGTWRVGGSGLNNLVHGLSTEWVTASSWLLGSNTPGLFGVPAVPGPRGIGYSLMCMPTGERIISGTSNLAPGFVHAPSQSYADISGELKSSMATCAQPVPLVIARDLEIESPTPQPNPDTASAVLDASKLLRDCVTELSVRPPATSGSDTTTTRSNKWFKDRSRCVSLARLLPLVEWLTPDSSQVRPRGGVESRILQRTIAQWLEVQSFLARQAANESALDDVLSRDPQPNDPASLPNALAMVETGLDFILRSKVATALVATTRDALRMPDYRTLRPVAYYTFDPEDMNGLTTAHDLAGENRLTIPSGATRTAANTKYINSTNLLEASIGRGPLELSGDLTISIRTGIPSLTVGASRTLLEYGDDSNLAFQIFVKGTATNVVELYAYHGARGSSGANAVKISNSIASNVNAGSTTHIVVRRRALYSSDTGSVTWNSEYKAWVNGGDMTAVLANVAIPTNFNFPRANAAAPGKLNIQGSIDEVAVWDEALDTILGNPGSLNSNVDNYLLTALSSAIAVPNDENHEQDIGLAPQLLETTAAYLRATTTEVSTHLVAAHSGCATGNASSPSRRAVLDRFGRALRYAWALESLASRLETRAETRGCSADAECATGQSCPTTTGVERVCTGVPTQTPAYTPSVPYKARFDRARDDLDAARSLLLAIVRPLISCDDPMGVPESALPLFFGDVGGTNSRFFAASDYLLNTWAKPAVDRATSALEAARNAWTQKRSSEIQQIQTENDRATRLEQIVLSHAAPIAELCGLTEVGGLQILPLFESRVLTTENCFIRQNAQCSGDPFANASCLRGSLGTSAIALTSAKRDVDVAVIEARGNEDRYEAESLYCSIEQDAVTELNEARERHNNRMDELRVQRALVSAAAGLLGGLSGSITSGNPLAFMSSAVEAGGLALDVKMQRAQDNFAEHEQRHHASAQIRQCFHGADTLKHAINTSHAQVRRRLLDIQMGLLEMQNRKDEVKRHVREGLAAYRRESGRTVPSVAHHYWLDERIDRFRMDFAWAKRLTYLAVRAVEYEFQQSLTLENEVLEAANPNALLNVIIALDQEQAGRTINGRRPEETSVVLSLREDVLQTYDRSHPPDELPRGERYWNASRRFAERLRSPEFAVYDENGDYLGQGIPFSLKATGALEYRCAERLWRVNATVQGDVIDVTTPSVPVLLLKRNTFTSQWCDGKGGRENDNETYQLGSVRPSAELFRPGGSASADGETGAFSSALLFPWFNVIRSEFYREQYLEGSSEELAGRGLYGDYVLLFPESGLLEWTDADPENDFALNRVEDVLVRFDLLSVDDLAL